MSTSQQNRDDSERDRPLRRSIPRSPTQPDPSSGARTSADSNPSHFEPDESTQVQKHAQGGTFVTVDDSVLVQALDSTLVAEDSTNTYPVDTTGTAVHAMPQYTSRDVGDPTQIKKNKQSMADLKLRRLTELNNRLREDLERERIPVSQASKR